MKENRQVNCRHLDDVHAVQLLPSHAIVQLLQLTLLRSYTQLLVSSETLSHAALRRPPVPLPDPRLARSAVTTLSLVLPTKQ